MSLTQRLVFLLIFLFVISSGYIPKIFENLIAGLFMTAVLIIFLLELRGKLMAPRERE